MNVMNLSTRITVSYVTVQLTDITIGVYKHWAYAKDLYEEWDQNNQNKN
jgi:uncharacterized membrane protein YjgN (DUF898 family)